jgi:hypothetical protein
MAASPGQKRKVETVMHAFREGDLESCSGATVGNRKQAVAIALSQSGRSIAQSPKRNEAKKREAAHTR